MNFSLSRKYSKPLPLRSAGIALVSVLWLVLLLSGLAATVAYIARIEALLARRAFDLAHAQAAADAAVVDTISRLSEEDASRRPPIGAPRTWEFDGIPIVVTVSREAGRINLNAGSDELLLAFLQAQGADEQAASTLVKELRNWQQAGSESLGRSMGAHYPSDLSTSTPARSLLTIKELKDVPGWHEQNLDCWMDSLTVYSGQGDVAASEATPGALATLRWMQTHHPDRSQAAASAAPRPTNSGSLVGEAVRIHAVVTVSEVSATSEWIGRLTGSNARPALTMLWDHSLKDESATCSTGR